LINISNYTIKRYITLVKYDNKLKKIMPRTTLKSIVLGYYKIKVAAEAWSLNPLSNVTYILQLRQMVDL